MAAIAGQKFIIPIYSPSEGVLVAFIEVVGAPVELLQIDRSIRCQISFLQERLQLLLANAVAGGDIFGITPAQRRAGFDPIAKAVLRHQAIDRFGCHQAEDSTVSRCFGIDRRRRGR